MGIPFAVAAALLGGGTGSGEEGEGGGGGGGGGEVPSVPANFQVAIEGNTTITLTWTDATGETYYRLERGTSPTVLDTVVAGAIPAGTTSYQDTSLSNGTTYYYKLTAGNSHGTSAGTDVVSGTPAAPPGEAPDAPSDVAAAMQATNTTIRVTWTDNSADEDQFNIYRSVNGGGYSLLTTAAANAEQYDDTGLTLGNTYAYKVSAENGSGESAEAGPATITNLGAVGTPTGLTATLDGTTTIDLSWSYDDSPPNGDEDGFYVYRDDVLIDTVGAGVTTYEDPGLTAGVVYEYKVSAFNNAGEGSKSASDTAATILPAPSGLAWEFLSVDPVVYRFTWTDNSSTESGFQLEKNDGGFATAAVVGAGVTQVDLDEATYEVAGFAFRVKARGNPGVALSDPSNEVTPTAFEG